MTKTGSRTDHERRIAKAGKLSGTAKAVTRKQVHRNSITAAEPNTQRAATQTWLYP